MKISPFLLLAWLLSVLCPMPVAAQEINGAIQCPCDCCSIANRAQKPSADALNRLVAEMNSATGRKKRKAMADLLNALVQQQKELLNQISALRGDTNEKAGCETACQCCAESSAKEPTHQSP